MRRFGAAAVGLVAVLAASVPTPARALLGSADRAWPRYRAASVADSGNQFSCSGSSCQFIVRTVTNGPTTSGCFREIVTLHSWAPALYYANPPCTVAINGWFTPVDLTLGSERQCALTAALDVEFNSGANSVFSGTFQARATFTPTRTETDPQGAQRVRQARVAVMGGSPPAERPSAFATIDRTFFEVTFPAPGPTADLCRPVARIQYNQAGALRPLTVLDSDGTLDHGVVTVQY